MHVHGCGHAAHARTCAQVVEVKDRRISDLELLHEAQSDGPTMPPALNQALRRALPI
jgi:hypothetical protein